MTEAKQTTPQVGAGHANTTGSAGGVVKLTGGSLLAQSLAVLASPAITRLGRLEVRLCFFVSRIAGVLACMRYERAILLPEKDEEAANVLALGLMIALVVAIIGVAVVFLGRQIISVR